MTKHNFLRGLRCAAPTALAIALLSFTPTAPAFADARPESMSAYNQGFARFQRGDFRGARIELLKAIKADPNNGLARLLQARVMLELGNGIAAQTELERALQAGVPRNKTRHLMANALLLQGQYDRALAEADARVVPPQFAAYAARMRGRALIALKQLEKARAEFDLAARLSPNDPNVALDIARYRLIVGDKAGAEASVDRALARSPDNIKALLLKGDLIRARLGLSSALAYFDKAVERDPNNIEALLERAATLGDMRREREARADLKRAEGLAPDHPLALYLEAVLAARAGQYAQASALMTRTKGLLNGYPPALLLQGMLAYQLGDMGQASEYLSKVVAQVPNNALARKLYAATQLRKRDNDGALDTLRPLLEQDPDARTLALAGSAYARKGDYEQAQTYLERAATAAPGAEEVRTQLALTRVARGDNAGAAAELQQILKADKDSLQALMMVSLLNLRQGKYKEAQASASRIVAAYPQLPMGYNMRGAALLGLNNIKAAEADFRTALQKKPGYREARRNLAQLLIATGRPAEGQRELLRAIEEDRTDAPSMLLLANLAAQQGHQAERIEWLRRAVTAQPQALEPRVGLVQAYIQANQPNRALNEASALERDFPKNPTVLQLVGMTQLAAKRAGDAETTFGRLVDLLPSQVQPRVLLARAQVLEGKIDAARQTYNQALTLPKQNLAPVYAELAALEVRQKQIPAAIKVINRLRAAYPKLNAADLMLGDIQMSAGQAPQAIKAYEAARRIKFDQATATRLAGAYAAAGQPNDALATLQAFSKANPNNLPVLAAIADLYLAGKQYRPAIAVYEQLRAKGGARSPLIMNNLAWAYHQVGDKRAAATAETAWRLAPKSASILDTTGWILVDGRSNPKRGLALLQQAIKLNPRDPDMRYHLAAAYRLNGQVSDAARELQIALQTPQFENRARAQQMLAQLRRG